MIVRARAPLRIGLAGGGTDVSPYCDEHGGAVLNATIDMHAHAVIEPLDNDTVEFAAPDIGQNVTFRGGDAIEPGGDLALHKAVYRRLVPAGARPLSCRVTTFCDAPPGSGLGTSSTMVVALVSAFAEWLNLPLGEYDVARLAFDIERVDAGLAGGRQDQYAATFGGVNFMEFHAGERVIVNPLRIKGWIVSELETRLVLFDSGTSRSSAAIIEDQTRNLAERRQPTIDAFHALKAGAYAMKEALLKGEFDTLAAVLHGGWAAKRNLAAAVSNDHIDAAMQDALDAGAQAGKVSGAGGGGFLTLLVDPVRKPDVVRALARHSGRVMPCHLTRHGAEAWRIP